MSNPTSEERQRAHDALGEVPRRTHFQMVDDALKQLDGLSLDQVMEKATEIYPNELKKRERPSPPDLVDAVKWERRMFMKAFLLTGIEEGWLLAELGA